MAPRDALLLNPPGMSLIRARLTGKDMDYRSMKGETPQYTDAIPEFILRKRMMRNSHTMKNITERSTHLSAVSMYV